jgi:hypothetical protein
MNASERGLRLLLRMAGSLALLATLAAFMPQAWMGAIHARLGMGELSRAPVVGYLAGSTSLLYAAMGGLMWAVSFDLRRHRPLIAYLGCASVLFGAALAGVCAVEGMPLWWTLAEGAFDVAFGAAVLALQRRLRPGAPER